MAHYDDPELVESETSDNIGANTVTFQGKTWVCAKCCSWRNNFEMCAKHKEQIESGV